jgi:hypothetical protein
LSTIFTATSLGHCGHIAALLGVGSPIYPGSLSPAIPLLMTSLTSSLWRLFMGHP